jgi:hypothetical protein
MWFTRNGKRIIKADISEGIYIVSWIAKGLQETAFPAKELKEDSYSNLHTNPDHDHESSSDNDSNSRKGKSQGTQKDTVNNKRLSNSDLKRYELMH